MPPGLQVYITCNWWCPWVCDRVKKVWYWASTLHISDHLHLNGPSDVLHRIFIIVCLFRVYLFCADLHCPPLQNCILIQMDFYMFSRLRRRQHSGTRHKTITTGLC
jgi:hypothetical protein